MLVGCTWEEEEEAAEDEDGAAGLELGPPFLLFLRRKLAKNPLPSALVLPLLPFPSPPPPPPLSKLPALLLLLTPSNSLPLAPAAFASRFLRSATDAEPDVALPRLGFDDEVEERGGS